MRGTGRGFILSNVTTCSDRAPLVSNYGPDVRPTGSAVWLTDSFRLGSRPRGGLISHGFNRGDMGDLAATVERALDCRVSDLTPLDGAEVGSVFRVTLADGTHVVAKTGQTPLTVEARMLTYLARRSDLPVPAVRYGSDDLLVLEYVAGNGEVTPAVERDAAEHVANLHGVVTDAFGFPFDTLSGPLDQPNPWTDSWIQFFRENRLTYVADIAVEAGSLPETDRERISELAGDLEVLLTSPDAAALVHGDLWTENLIVADRRVAAFLDPACYYGHPEVDLAYIRWTDTFGDAFFERYRDCRDRDPDQSARRRFRERMDVYAIHPLLEHVWYFDDDAYLRELRSMLLDLGY